MSSPHQRSPHPPTGGPATAVTTDAALPEIAVLLGPDALGALAPVVAADGQRLRRLTPQQVLYRPGRGATVRYRAEMTGTDGEHTTATLVAACGRDDPGDTAAVEAGDVRIAVWSPATDPRLPGLGSALDRRTVSKLLRDLGVEPGDVRLRLRSYRPARRAVVEVTSATARIYLKVVPPDAAERLHAHHVALSEHLPVPRSHGWSPELGIVVLQALGGRTLRTALNDGTRSLPGAAAIEDLLDRLPPVDGEPARRSPHQPHCALLGHVVPDLAARLDGLATRLDELAATDPGPVVAVHGDLHDAQLLVAGEKITGLLDVDGHGAGHRADDLGALLAHLAVRDPGAHATSHARHMAPAFERRHGARAVRTAAAVRTVGLATGPFRVLQDDWVDATRARVELAERWVAAAEDEDLLTPITPTPQGHGAPLQMSA